MRLPFGQNNSEESCTSRWTCRSRRAVTYFRLVGGSTAAVPILGYAVWTHRIDRFLAAFHDWMQRRQRVLTLIVLVLLGVALVYSGASVL
ncbi:hypothetical protein MHPYR_100138 [uncultured Mycobacterium sp.]|uniref:Uncharacterized protein n=1 Tax=uncultured Mycobacterium sp. TaxID=171292 RepID=A0A1Y5NXJ6_9MYCO|nr:hypothetical protein MHPYR_100138 [uncultured Mycobacterium sp.]